MADARRHGRKAHAFHASVFLQEFLVPELAGPGAPLDGTVEEGILGAEVGEQFTHADQRQGVAQAIRNLPDGGIDGATRRLARLKGDSFGEESPAGQRG